MKKLKHFQEGRGYTREDWDDADIPELTDEQIAKGLPMSEAMPEVYAALIEAIEKRGATRTKKTPVSIRLDDDVIEKLRASGPGWQSRANDALREFVEREG
jgi:uncharacterized protein (DUF4415 family)